jgi:hypothetical protein
LPAQAQSAGRSSTPSTAFSDPNPSSISFSNDKVNINKEDANVSEWEAELVKNAGTEFVDSIFGTDTQLEATKKVKAITRLWNLRFDANCEEILRRLTQ